MPSRKKIAFATASAAVAAIGAFMPAATADTSAQPNDAVIVGSDTLQFAADFVADGAPDGTAGYNSNSLNRIFDSFATGDANGRATGAGGTGTTIQANAETQILRAGTQPVLRPNGSGKGVAALIADVNPQGASSGAQGTGYSGLPLHSINAVRMSRLPTSSASVASNSEDAQCDAITACGGLHVYEIANDTLQMVKLTTGSVAVPLDATQLWHVYNCDAGYTTWNGAGIGGTSSDPIIPVIPQSGSGTRTFFLATINAAAGKSTNPSLACAVTAQEHDPTGITGSAAPKDAIEPFSTARLNLINATNGIAKPYFNNSNGPATPVAGYTPNTLTALTGTLTDPNATGAQPAFSTLRAVYLVVRQADLNLDCSPSTTPCFRPGTSGKANNAANSLVNAFSSSTFANDIAQAGFTPKFQDCLVDPDDSASSNNVCVKTP